MRKLVTDGEGPVTKNDNAFELSSFFIPNGESFFAVVSSYDDVLAYIVKKEGYKAGDTLRLILPFLKAYGATDRAVEEYSRKNILLMPGAKEVLRLLEEISMPVYMISTSYEPYVKAVCEALGFSLKNARFTKLTLDGYALGNGEAERLKELSKEISRMPPIKIPPSASSIEDFPEEEKRKIARLDQIFWEELPSMEAYRMVEEINPVGGTEKANALKEILDETGNAPSDIIYVGDSITDVQAMRLVRGGGGLSVSFNGNVYALREAEVAVIAHHALPTAIISELFFKEGKEAAVKLAKNWGRKAVNELPLNKNVKKAWLKLEGKEQIKLSEVKKENLTELVRESVACRKKVRGERIGELG